MGLMGFDFSQADPAVTISPLDGRYRAQTVQITNFLSEPALNRYRLHVEVEWLIYLCQHRVLPSLEPLTTAEVDYLRAVVENFGPDEVAELAEIENQTRHDVKAVEYFLKKRLQQASQVLQQGDGQAATSLPGHVEIVHIFCTSEDINNLAWALGVRDALQSLWLVKAQELQNKLSEMARLYRNMPMLSRTHGQTATPTTVGKELAVFAYRLQRQLQRVSAQEFLGKFNGATGTYGAHAVAASKVDWLTVSRGFVESLGLQWNPLTTQIESHDWQSELYADMARAGRIMHNIATDMWTYISLGYFSQNLQAQGNTGSSTMPHKVNPIRFENAEANLEIAAALFETLAATIVTSRLQRDLTDSSTQRNIGVAFGHSLVAMDNLLRGLAGVEANPGALEADISQAWEVLGEPIQQTLRVALLAGETQVKNPYEKLKAITRGRKITASDMYSFIDGLGLPPELTTKLQNLAPNNYIGLAAKLVDYLED